MVATQYDFVNAGSDDIHQVQSCGPIYYMLHQCNGPLVSIFSSQKGGIHPCRPRCYWVLGILIGRRCKGCYKAGGWAPSGQSRGGKVAKTEPALTHLSPSTPSQPIGGIIIRRDMFIFAVRQPRHYNLIVNCWGCFSTVWIPCSKFRREMPGHVKRGGTGEPDPDPTEYLFITYEEKQKVIFLVLS